jgi:hypothetical protein
MSEASPKRTDEEKQTLMELACIWAQAAAVSERLVAANYRAA